MHGSGSALTLLAGPGSRFTESERGSTTLDVNNIIVWPRRNRGLSYLGYSGAGEDYSSHFSEEISQLEVLVYLANLNQLCRTNTEVKERHR